MAARFLEDAVRHHTWATLRLLDACASLTPEQLSTSVPGTFGSILDTLRHIVGADRWYLELLSGGAIGAIDEDAMSLFELRAAMAAGGPVWETVLANATDADQIIVRRHEDGSEVRNRLGIRLAQVVHHGTDHRSQVATALTSLGIEPPPIDVWAYDEASSAG